MSNAFVVIGRFAINLSNLLFCHGSHLCKLFPPPLCFLLPIIFHLTITLRSIISPPFWILFFTSSFLSICNYYPCTSLPFIPCFAHKKVITLFLFSILLLSLGQFFFFFPCNFAFGWFVLVLCFLIPPIISPMALVYFWFELIFNSFVLGFWVFGSRGSSLYIYIYIFGYMWLCI